MYKTPRAACKRVQPNHATCIAKFDCQSKTLQNLCTITCPCSPVLLLLGAPCRLLSVAMAVLRRSLGRCSLAAPAATAAPTPAPTCRRRGGAAPAAAPTPCCGVSWGCVHFHWCVVQHCLGDGRHTRHCRRTLGPRLHAMLGSGARGRAVR